MNILMLNNLRNWSIWEQQREASPGFLIYFSAFTGDDVAKLCASFGGGGHERAAGCTLDCDSIDMAKNTILSAIENLLNE